MPSKKQNNSIQAYRIQNYDLKAENRILRELTQAKQQKSSQEQCEELQRTILKQSEKIRDILEDNLAYEKKISHIQRELRDVYNKEMFLEKKQKKSQRSRQRTLATEDGQKPKEERILERQQKEKDDLIVRLLKQVNHYQEASIPQKKASSTKERFQLQTGEQPEPESEQKVQQFSGEF